MGINGSMSGSTLDSLGPCFASHLSDKHLHALNASELISKISYFQGANFQPNKATAEIFSSKIDSYLNSTTSHSEKENLIFNTLQDTALFVSDLKKFVSNV